MFFLAGIKQKTVRLVEVLHLRLFGHEMGEEMRKFLGNLSISIFGGVAATAIMFLVSILGARFLGPEGFGMYNSVLSFASALAFLLLLGSDSGIVRFVSDKNHKEEGGGFLTSSLLFVIFVGLFFLFVSFLFYEKIDGLTNGNAFLAIALAVALSMKALADAFLRSYQLFARQSLLRIIDALLVIAFFFFAFFLFGKETFNYYIYALIFGTTFFITVSFWLLRKNFGSFSWSKLVKLLNYQKYLIIAGIGGIFIGLEKYFVGKFIGVSDLGIYSVYHAASFLIIANLGSMFMNVFWPTVIRNNESIEMILKKLIQLFSKAFVFWVILDSILIFLVLKVSGSEYAFYFSYAVLFSVISFFAFVYSIFVSILNINNIGIATIFSLVIGFAIVLAIIFSGSLQVYIFSQVAIYVIASLAAFMVTRIRVRAI
jgi:O-antigen/teichoic acid export membrane protein